MSTLAQWVLAALLALPVSKADREVDPSVKRAQLETIATAIATASSETTGWPGSNRELAAFLVTIARYESALAMHIHAGNCRPWECDRGRARGLYQLHAHRSFPEDQWQRAAGLDAESTLFSSRAAARAVVRSRGLCRSLERRGGDWVAMTFSAYAGRGCVGWFSGRDLRVSSFRRLQRL